MLSSVKLTKEVAELPQPNAATRPGSRPRSTLYADCHATRLSSDQTANDDSHDTMLHMRHGTYARSPLAGGHVPEGPHAHAATRPRGAHGHAPLPLYLPC